VPNEKDAFESRDLEWEVTHKKSKIHKGRGNTPEAALRDLRDGFAKGVGAAQEEIEREQRRLDHLNELLADTEPGHRRRGAP
jgi:hypothetical protein